MVLLRKVFREPALWRAVLVIAPAAAVRSEGMHFFLSLFFFLVAKPSPLGFRSPNSERSFHHGALTDFSRNGVSSRALG